MPVRKGMLAVYRPRFPNDPGVINLDHWQAFERDNPGIFWVLYQFWLLKAL